MLTYFSILTVQEMYILKVLYDLQKHSNFCGVFNEEMLYNDEDISKVKLVHILSSLSRKKMIKFVSLDFYSDMCPCVTPMGRAWIEDVAQKVFSVE